MKVAFLGLAIITLLPPVFGLQCHHCWSDVSWEDCQSSRKETVCDVDLVCFKKVLKITSNGTIITDYWKGCEERRHCDPKTCNNKKMACEIHCCEKDLCNTGILGREPPSNASFLLSPAAFFVAVVSFVLLLMI